MSRAMAASAAAPVPDEECEKLLDDLGRCKTKEDMEAMGFEPLTVGFANVVCGAVRNRQPLVIKRYTDLVFLRLTPEAVGAVDAFAGERGAGPRVFHSSPRGLVMERRPGDTLEEADMHRGDLPLLEAVAKALASFHVLPLPRACEGQPMLWRTIDKMMEVVAQKPELMPASMPGIEPINAAIRGARAALEEHSPRLVLGHGDFKPSNVIRHLDTVTLIDFELGGPNYRGFDLMKVFRTALPMSEACMRHFLRTYAEQVGDAHVESDVQALVEETLRFEPLTWLEAAVFFLTLPQFKPDETSRWNALALDRWTKFEETRHKLASSAPSPALEAFEPMAVPCKLAPLAAPAACRQGTLCFDQLAGLFCTFFRSSAQGKA